MSMQNLGFQYFTLIAYLGAVESHLELRKFTFCAGCLLRAINLGLRKRMGHSLVERFFGLCKLFMA